MCKIRFIIKEKNYIIHDSEIDINSKKDEMALSDKPSYTIFDVDKKILFFEFGNSRENINTFHSDNIELNIGEISGRIYQVSFSDQIQFTTSNNSYITTMIKSFEADNRKMINLRTLFEMAKKLIVFYNSIDKNK